MEEKKKFFFLNSSSKNSNRMFVKFGKTGKLASRPLLANYGLLLPLASLPNSETASTKPPDISRLQRNQVEREVGRGIGMENTCKSMADSCQCMTKTTTIL